VFANQHTLVRFTMRRVAAAAFVLLAASATPANAAATDATLSIEGTQGAPGVTVSVAVDLSNQSGPVRGLQFTLSADPSVVSVECSNPCDAVHATGRSQGFTVDASQQLDRTIRVVLVSLGGATISPGNGAVLILDLMVSATASEPAITLTPTDVRIAGVTGEQLTTTAIRGTIALGSPPPAAGGGGGGGGCALSDRPARPDAHSWLIFAVVLTMIRTRLRAPTRTH
jgi:hypothetical protein